MKNPYPPLLLNTQGSAPPMKSPLTALAAGLALLGSASAFAASTVDLTVTGLIVPSACSPSLSNGGAIDHGKVSAKDLHPDRPTQIGSHSMTLTVVCDGTTVMAVNAIDNRAGSSSIPSETFGLGLTHDNRPLGYFFMAAYNAVADGVAVDTITSRDGGDTWTDSPRWHPGYYLSAAAPDTPLQPAPLKELTATMALTTWIEPTNNLDLSDDLPIDGSATLEMKYL
jgi:hypothetical protein